MESRIEQIRFTIRQFESKQKRYVFVRAEETIRGEPTRLKEKQPIRQIRGEDA